MSDLEEAKGQVPKDYSENRWIQFGFRCLGSFCYVFLGLCIVSYVVHAIPLPGSFGSMPANAHSLLWASIVHHTDAYKNYKVAFPPPPPTFVRM